MKKRTLNRYIADEKGQALIIVMILMLVSALVIVPMLSHVGSGWHAPTKDTTSYVRVKDIIVSGAGGR